MTRRIDPDLLQTAAVIAAKAAGCTCTPEITITEPAPGIHSAEVAHDDSCTLIARKAAPWN